MPAVLPLIAAPTGYAAFNNPPIKSAALPRGNNCYNSYKLYEIVLMLILPALQNKNNKLAITKLRS
jgi:hypothetical protein